MPATSLSGGTPLACTSCDGDPYAQAVGGCRDCTTDPAGPRPAGAPWPYGARRTLPPGRITDPLALGRATQGLLVLVTVLPLVAAAAEAVSGSATTPVGQAARLCGMPALAVTGIVFVCWFARYRANAELLAPGGNRYGQGWAVGAWVVPFAMWWIPHRIARDVWRAGAPPRAERLVHLWWAAWLARTVGALVLARLGIGIGVFETYVLVANTVAGVLAVLLVERITKVQSWHASGRPAVAVATS